MGLQRAGRRGEGDILEEVLTTDTFRRNLQRGYLERLNYLMTEEPPQASSFAALFTTDVDVSQSNIRPFVGGELTH